MNFMKQLENLIPTLKCAIRIYASKDEANRAEEEQRELRNIERILNNQPEEVDEEEEEGKREEENKDEEQKEETEQ